MVTWETLGYKECQEKMASMALQGKMVCQEGPGEMGYQENKEVKVLLVLPEYEVL